MKRERLVKCYGVTCESTKQKHAKSAMQEISGKNYCPECYPKILQEKQDRDSLYQFVYSIFGTQFSSVGTLVKTQIKRFKEKENLKYKGMEITLYYMVNIENIKFDNRGIALLPYYYDRAREWYVKSQSLQKQARNFQVKENVVFVSPKRIANRYKEEKLLSMEDL